MNEIEENLNFGKHECENHHETKKSDYICVKSNFKVGYEWHFTKKMTLSTISGPCIGLKMNKIEKNSNFGKCESENHHETEK